MALTLPLRFAPLRLLGLSRATSPRTPCYAQIQTASARPPRGNPTPFGVGYARIGCGCGRARGLGYGGNGGYGRERWRARWGRRDASRRAGVMGLRAPARGDVRLRYGACASRRAGVMRLRAPPSSYISTSTYLLTANQRGDGMSPPTATHSGARIKQLCARAVSYQAYHRADCPSRALRAAHAGTAARYERACLWLGI